MFDAKDVKLVVDEISVDTLSHRVVATLYDGTRIEGLWERAELASLLSDEEIKKVSPTYVMGVNDHGWRGITKSHYGAHSGVGTARYTDCKKIGN